MRIAYFVEGMSTSGVETSTQLLAETLRKHGHRVTFFVPWAEDEFTGSHCDVYRLPSLRVNAKQDVYWSYPLSLKLIAKFLRDPYDLIHVHTSSSINLLVWQISRALDVPLIYTYHTMSREYRHYLGSLAVTMAPLMDSAIRTLDRTICNAADIVTTPSQKAAEYLREIGITPPLHVIPNGIDLAQFEHAPATYRGDYRSRRMGIGDDAKLLLFVGRLNQEKRPMEAYQVFRAVARRMGHVHLAMAGEGPLSAALAERASWDGLADRLHLLGRVPHAEMSALYNAADVWISTSTSEVHPMAALEAAACGLPAVAMRDRALEGVVIHNSTGLIADQEAQMVSGVYLLLNDPALHERMSEAARENARRFDIEVIGKQMMELYASALGWT
jgi:1,2-diacylglycerol 3-alpha-glucosyltransferase